MTRPEVKVSFHGHSDYSDGLETIPQLVEAAGKADVRFFGVSDHNTVAGLQELYEAVDAYNQKTGAGMQMISAIEMNIGGHVVFAKLGRDKQFTAWAQRVSEHRYNYSVKDAIQESVAHHDAIVDLVHPAVLGTPSISFFGIRELGDALKSEIKRNVGIETANWMSLLFQPHTALREARLRQLARECDFATFGGSDFHAGWMINRLTTVYDAQEATAASFLAAVQNRTIRPSRAEWSSSDMLHLASDLIKVHKIAKAKNID